ncbi:MAG: hypothetical protein AAB787_01375 [Patescibacteria group bacterium]
MKKLPSLVILVLLAISTFTVNGCGKKKSTGPIEPPKEIVNEIPEFEGSFRVVIEAGVRAGYLFLFTDTLEVDTFNVCPDEFPLVSESQPDYGFTIETSSGKISDSVVDFTQSGQSLSFDLFCENDTTCDVIDSCTVPFSINVSSRKTGNPPRPSGFKLIAIFTSKDCDGQSYESINRYSFIRIGDADCSGDGVGKIQNKPDLPRAMTKGKLASR